MAEPETRRISVSCPGCGGRLTVDASTGEVLAHRPPERPAGGGKSFEGLLAGLERERAEAEEVFAREVAAQKDRDRLLDEKFREAVARANEDPDSAPPPRPFDFD